ncbi:NAD(P)H-dependent flavin oxidoreductase [Alicyclobacillus herbarius]|uniref:NAD(P)H-dependent flavin oxidoreductase n=1 Tax=Alicyclobacillus herbarius TaxID=122960 RepID=UPI000406BEBA|nr:DUF561 domain-containing protein [Alicyclobacillus herbarius]
MLNTRITELLKIRYPLIQAGMAGGPTTPELVAAVSNQGGLGTIGGGYLRPDALRDQIRRVRELTERPFAVNLFALETVPDIEAAVVEDMNAYLNEIREDLGLSQRTGTPAVEVDFEEQVEVVVEEKVPVFSFTFGIPGEKTLQRLKEHAVIIGTATTVREAVLLEQAGVDAVVAQGSEAGGHRGTFAEDDVNRALIGTMALVPQVVDKVQIPVIASGGIMDGRGLVAALALGASAVQMGTAFLTCLESGVHQAYKQRLQASDEDETELTRAYSGKWARGLRTTFMERMAQYPGEIPPYPIQNALTQDIRRAAAETGNVEFMSLWAGQAHALAASHPAGALVQQVLEDAAATLRTLVRAASR